MKIGDAEKLLVLFAWCHDKEVNTATMFPDFWGCDTMFGLKFIKKTLYIC